MGTKVLGSIPNVAPGVDLICAGHPADPGKLPPGVVTVPCHRCGRPVALYRTPAPSSDEPATDFSPGAAPEAARRGATFIQEEQTLGEPTQTPRPQVDDDPDRTPGRISPVPARAETLERSTSATAPLETCEMPAVNITSEDLAELESTRKGPPPVEALPPPVPVEESDILEETGQPSDEPTIRQGLGPPPPSRRTASR